ncbi:diguanylate cyclase [Xanthomonas campestris pv. raphani]|uniref:sensor domain-containing diguanylate cyclase n=1 Tax=Xanthomonas campestris TaxID=339 RepID=UPI002B23AB67|nr:diguanylate cyclase [Xanthomonas campestris]MEA9796168.1 diguanylate cyclase [Xanthomonas campestris pv. raphani]
MADAPMQQHPLAHLHDIVHDNSDWIWEVDAQARYTFCSRACERLLGYTPEQILGRTPFDLMEPAEAARVGVAFAEIVAARRPFQGLLNRNVRADGRTVMLETSGIPLFDAQGALRGYRGIDRDVTPIAGGPDHSATNQRLFQLEALYAAAPVALCLIDRAARYLAVNEAMAGIAGRSVQEMIGMRVAQVFPQAAADQADAFATLAAGHDVPDQVFDWQDRSYHVRVRGVRDLEGRLIALTTALTDISEHLRVQWRLTKTTEALAEANRQLEQANAQLLGAARNDHLTGLANRRGFDRAFERLLPAVRDGTRGASVLMLDVDYFKQYNDRYGHPQGDQCLRDIAAALRSVVTRGEDVVARYGGEEFALLLPDTDLPGAAEVARRLQERLAAMPISHAGSPCARITLSIGVTALQPQECQVQDARVREAVMARADRALYQAKNQGRNRVALAPV